MLVCPRLVGRAGELARLRAARPGAAVVHGEAGIGKSALIRAATDGAPTAVARAVPGGGPSAPAEWVLSVLAAGGSADRLGAHRPVLAAVVPGLLGDAAAGPVHPVLVGEALLRLWATVPVPRRPVLVFEDAHWADEATGAILRHVAGAATGLDATVIVSTRPEGPLWPVWQRLVETRDVVGVAVPPLAAGDVAGMVAACLDAPAVPPGLLERVGAAGGRPLLVEEVLADLAGSGSLRRDGTGWSLRPGAAGVPASVRSGAESRLAALPGASRRVVERAALLDRVVDTDLLAAASGLDADELGEHLRAAVGCGLLEVDPASGAPAFRHELLREAVLAGLVDAQRRAHAVALLDAAGASPAGARLATTARLAEIAGRPELAGRRHLRHAEHLLAGGLPLAAADAAERAAAVPEVTTAALAVQAEALALAGEVDRALAAAARHAARPDADTARTRLAVARSVAERGDWARAEDLLPRDAAEPAEVTALAALVALERGRYADAETTARAALAAAPSGAAACQALEVLGRLARRADLAAAEQLFARAVAVAESAGLALWRARALHEVATVAQLRTLDLAPLHVARAAAVEAGAPGLVTAVDFHLAAVAGVRFEPEPALAAARRVLADARALGATRQEAWAWVLTAQAHAVAGARAAASAAADEAMRTAPGDAEVRGIAEALGHGLAALLADDRDAGLARWHAGVVALRAHHGTGPMPPWYLWPVLATVADVEGDGGARARAETGTPDIGAGAGAEALWHLGAAVAAGRAGDVTAANRASTRAEALFAQVPAFAGWQHLGHRWVAEDAATHGWGTPGPWARDAAAWFADRGFAVVASACRGLARRSGVPQRRRRGDTPVPPDLAERGVTGREVDVLRLVADGLTNAEIAGRLYLSPRTVKGYVEQLLAKTGAANRVQLAALNPPSGPATPTAIAAASSSTSRSDTEETP